MKHRTATILFGATLLAGCTVPSLGTVTVSPQPKTVPESTSISQVCRAELAKLDPDTLNAFDVGMAGLEAGALRDPVGEAANLRSALVWGAQEEGIKDCG